VPRSTYYYQPQPETAENLRLMRKLDQLYMKVPFFGSRKMAVELEINRKRAQRLMRILGIEAHYAKPNLSRPAPGHQIYPYRCAASGSRDQITFGVPILPTFRCVAAFCIWSR
jgi:putative transposase